MRVLITGASRGLGQALAQYLTAEHTVYAWGSKQADFTCPTSTWDTVPQVDAIVHCAGGGLGLKSPTPTAEELYTLFMVNLGGQAEINRIALQHATPPKYLCHVCSIVSGEAIGSVGYGTVKAALAGYIRALGHQMARRGVVVTGIAPGAFVAPDNAMERLRVNSPAAYQDFLDRRLPRGVMGTAAEIIPLIEFLISPAASMMGGAVVPIDAGEGRYYAG